MKKIKKTKKNDIQKFLSCFDHAPENKKNSSYHPEIFSHRWDFLNNHYLDSNFFYFLKPPEKSEKFRFLNSKNTKNSKDQIYDQV